MKMEQCPSCTGYLFFEPLPNEIFACCQRHGEEVKDIDLKTGVSPAIKRHGLKGIPCKKIEQGKSICYVSQERPFSLHPIREKGEKELLAFLT